MKRRPLDTSLLLFAIAMGLDVVVVLLVMARDLVLNF